MVAQLMSRMLQFAWWASKTRVSPNKDDVMRKCLEVGVYDEKPTFPNGDSSNVYKYLIIHPILIILCFNAP